MTLKGLNDSVATTLGNDSINGTVRSGSRKMNAGRRLMAGAHHFPIPLEVDLVSMGTFEMV